MVHRDLKPENLLLDKDCNIKLIDFGLANSTKDSVALNTACGSPNYAAPEVISGQSYSGHEVDIWSCGVILYAMICGSLPFDDEQLAVLFMKIKQGNYRMPVQIPPDCKDLIRRMLQTNPVKRIKLSEIKQHRWYLQDLPVYLQELSKAPLKHENLIDQDLVRHLMNVSETSRSDPDILATRLTAELRSLSKRSVGTCTIKKA
jgi:serine/threonine protein kinase